MKELQVLTNALDAAIKAGVFNLQDAGNILQCINVIGQKLQSLEQAPAPKGEEEGDVLPPKKRPTKK